jgi:hypothetical protein
MDDDYDYYGGSGDTDDDGSSECPDAEDDDVGSLDLKASFRTLTTNECDQLLDGLLDELGGRNGPNIRFHGPVVVPQLVKGGKKGGMIDIRAFNLLWRRLLLDLQIQSVELLDILGRLDGTSALWCKQGVRCNWSRFPFTSSQKYLDFGQFNQRVRCFLAFSGRTDPDPFTDDPPSPGGSDLGGYGTASAGAADVARLEAESALRGPVRALAGLSVSGGQALSLLVKSSQELLGGAGVARRDGRFRDGLILALAAGAVAEGATALLAGNGASGGKDRSEEVITSGTGTLGALSGGVNFVRGETGGVGVGVSRSSVGNGSDDRVAEEKTGGAEVLEPSAGGGPQINL